ncbi:MAG TPA: tetratricopeptide repeat protein [Sphingomicrobium sp.]|nr:tetratricopeptide repeat protein [Sphingomicrobium sp.]
MKLITTTALAIVAMLSAAPAIAQKNGAQQQPAPAAQPKISPSKGALKAIVDLQTTVNKNDYASVPAKVAAANAVATTKDDKYLIGELQLKAAVAAKDSAGETAAIEEIATSGFLDPGKSSELYLSLGSTLYNNKQYPQAEAAFQKAAALDPRNSEAPSLLGEALFAQGQKAQAAAAFQRAIQASVAAGQKPDEKLLKRAVGVAYDANSPTAVDLSRQWVAAYPGPESWRNSIAIYRNLNHPDIEGTLDLLRLMQATGAMSQAEDYTLFARASAEQNNFNEAQAVLDAGIASKAVNPADPNVKDLVAGLKAKPKATAADLATATKSAVNGMALLRIGDRYYAMGDYSKAVELYRMAMNKPGVDAAVANLHIGMALARAGDKAGATTALNAVTGPRADIAKYWLTYVNQHA